MNKQYEARVTEVQQELEEASSKCEPFEKKAKDQAAEQTKLSTELQSEWVERRFYEEEVRQVKLMATGAFTTLPQSAAHVAKYFATDDGAAEQQLFWAQFEAPEANPSLSYQMKQLLELHGMSEPATKDLFVRLWPTEPLPNSYFSLVRKLIEAAPWIEALQRSACIEGARMAFSRMMVHFPRMRPLKLATDPPPIGKEHSRPELYFTSAMQVARAIESQCSKDVLLE
ncbi:hypothetical protein ZWY2020_051039 [Hordeum vulgare]|nr:hypothetical protein ZWY2020_051039 [Hordeum vulgare]